MKRMHRHLALIVCCLFFFFVSCTIKDNNDYFGGWEEHDTVSIDTTLSCCEVDNPATNLPWLAAYVDSILAQRDTLVKGVLVEYFVLLYAPDQEADQSVELDQIDPYYIIHIHVEDYGRTGEERKFYDCEKNELDIKGSGYLPGEFEYKGVRYTFVGEIVRIEFGKIGLV